MNKTASFFAVSLSFLLFAGCSAGSGVTTPSSLPAVTPIIAPVTPAPSVQITSVSPTTSVLAGGSILTVRGSVFSSGLTITVGAAACSSPSFISSTEATCVLPANVAGTYAVTVTNSDGSSATMSNAITYASAPVVPAISSVAPSSGSVNGRTGVTITGSNFQAGAIVRFDAVNCTSVTVVSSSTITCTTPSHVAGAVGVTVTNPDAQTNTLSPAYTYVLPPTYTTLKNNIFTPKCVSCHGASGGFATNIYSQILTKLVMGDPATSKLYIRTANETMPQGNPKLTAVEKQQVFDWIVDNAPDN